MMWWLMLSYQVCVTISDLLHLLLKAILLLLQAAWHIIVPPAPKSLLGEIILVTGAGHGLGRELSIQLGRLGAKVVCWDLNKESNEATASQVSKEGGSAWAIECNVADASQVHRASVKTREVVGDVTIIFNNAGIMPCKPFMKHSKNEIQNLFNVNVLAHFWIIQEWLPIFLDQGRGHIVGISSLCGMMGLGNVVPYCSSKFAVRGLIEGLIEETRYGGANPNVRFTRVHPYVVDTGLALKPRIRFPWLSPVLKADETVRIIIDGVRRNYEVIFVPPRNFYCYNFINLLPRSIQQAFLDFMDTGVDSHE